MPSAPIIAIIAAMCMLSSFFFLWLFYEKLPTKTMEIKAQYLKIHALELYDSLKEIDTVQVTTWEAFKVVHRVKKDLKTFARKEHMKPAEIEPLLWAIEEDTACIITRYNPYDADVVKAWKKYKLLKEIIED